MGRALLLLLLAAALWAVLGPAGLGLVLLLGLGLAVLRPLRNLFASLLLLALVGGWGATQIGRGDGATTPRTSPALPYKLLGFRWLDEELPLRVSLQGLRGLDGIPRRQARGAARRAMASWNQAAGRELLAPGKGTVEVVVRDCGPDNSAMTALRPDLDRPQSAVLCLNDPRARFSLAPSALEFDLETVLLHELGHVLGLDHPVRLGQNNLLLCQLGQPDRVMCPRRPGAVTRNPLEGDVAGLHTLYG